MNLNTRRMSRAESKVNTRQQLLDAARQVFEEKGFHGATVEDIVATAGYTRGAFYANWSDKAEALWDVLERANRERFEAIAAALDAAPMGEEMGVIQRWLDSLLGSWPLGRAGAELQSTVVDDDRARERVAGLYADERRIMGAVMLAIAEDLGVSLPVPVDHLAAMGIA